MASDVPLFPMRFFVLKKQNKGQHDTEYSTVKANIGPGLSCPQCGGPIGMLSWEPPYRVELELHGKEFGDLMEGPGGDLLVTERFAEDFKAEGLTGLSGFHPVEVVRVRRRRRVPHPTPPPNYLLVTPTYGPPALDLERCRYKSSKPMEQCSWCREMNPDAIASLALDEGTWKGEDVFRPRGLWGRVIVSERFMHFAERHAMSHMKFVPIENYLWDPLGLYEGEHLH